MATAGAGRGAGPERAFCSPLPPAGVVRLDPEESRHLVRVRRVEPGDEVVLFDGEGATRLSRLVRAAPEDAECEIVSDYPGREPRRRVGVAVAFAGAGRADDLVAALSECGVFALVPLRSRRGAVDVSDLFERRRSRWARLAREAAKVNGRSRLLEVLSPVAVEQVAAFSASASPPWSPVLLDTDPSLPPLSAVAVGLASPLLLIGPEGGFSPEEAAALMKAQVPAASLGACVLRTETAAICAAAIALGV